MRKQIIFILLLLPFIITSQTINKISGRVTDSLAKPIESVIISLLKSKDSSLVKTSFSDQNGDFEFNDIKADSFLVSIFYLNFKNYLSGLIVYPQGTTDLKLPVIQLKENLENQLSEVTVSTKIPFVQRKIDRTIINPEALISNAAGNALDVLAKSPGVMVGDNGLIKLKGKSGVIILIDNKPTYLTGSELENYLKSIPSSSIKQIELMTNPPAQYDAAGNSGIINIITKRTKLKGINGGFSLNYSQGRYPKTNNNLNLNFSNKKLSIFSNLSYGYYQGFHDLTISRQYKNDDLTTKSIFTQNTYIKPTNQSYAAKLGFDYYLTEKTSIGVSTKALYNTSTETKYNYAQFLNPDQTLSSTIIADNSESDIFKNGTFNLNFRHKFDTTEKTLTADLDYVTYSTILKQNFINNVYLPNGTTIYNDNQSGSLPSNIIIYAFKSDYTQPLSKNGKLDFGLKTSYTQTDNDAVYLITQNNFTQNNYNLSNHFKYDEMINASYLNFSKSLKRLQIQSGLRFESTVLNGKQLGNPKKEASSFSRSYNNLFPTLYFSYQLDTSSTNLISLSYGKRVNRPFYKDLNPFSSPLDKYTFYEGNPYLKPTFAHNLSLSYSYKQLFTTTISYNNTKDQIQETIEINNGIYYSRPGNIGSSVQYNISIEGSLPIKKILTINLYSEVMYSEFKSKLYTETLNSSGTYWYINVNNSFQLAKGVSAELSGEYITNFIDSQFSFGDFGHINIGLQKKVLNDLGTIKFSVNDLLFTDRVRGRINNLYLTDANWYGPRDTRIVSLTFSYRFGKNLNSKSKHTTGSSDAEQNRVKG